MTSEAEDVKIDVSLFGFAVDADRLFKYLFKRRAGSCLRDPNNTEDTEEDKLHCQCLCGPTCWGEGIWPSTIHYAAYASYQAVDEEHKDCFIRLQPDSDVIGAPLPASIASDPRLTEKYQEAKKFMDEHALYPPGTNRDPKLYSLKHVVQLNDD
jgi:hypothetical protein